MGLTRAITSTVSALSTAALASNTPLAGPCRDIIAPSAVCINRYASVMPQPFLRFHAGKAGVAPNDTFPATDVPSDPSWDLLDNAQFLVFDQEPALAILGPDPSLELIFDLPPGTVREAPVYVPSINSIIFSTFQEGTIPQSIIDLNQDPPTLQEFVPDPPVYGINGGRYHNGSVYWAVAGGFPFQGPNGSTVLQTPGIIRLNPVTRKTEVLVNNYYGARFNSPDDVVVASNGDVFFTDPWYGFSENLTSAPIAPPATWRFCPSTGRAQVIETSLTQPNGIALSPDEKTLYIGDTGLTVFDQPAGQGFSINSTLPRQLYAFDLVDGPSGKYPINKRPLFMAHEFGTDGVQISREGYIVGATGTAVDVLTPSGELVVQIRVNYIVNNVQFVGPDRDELWIFGYSGISRVKWELQGIELKR